MTRLLASVIRKYMSQRGIKTVDFAKKTMGRVRLSFLQSIFRGSLPDKIETLDDVSMVLKVPKEELRKLACVDHFSRILETHSLTLAKQARPSGRHPVEDEAAAFYPTAAKEIREILRLLSTELVPTVNVYAPDEVVSKLDQKGYPVGSSNKRLPLVSDYGRYSYGVLLTDNSLAPRATAGEILIMSQDYKVEPDCYGLIRLKDKVLIGRIRTSPTTYLIETSPPFYQSLSVYRKDVLFIHKNVAVLSGI